MRVDSEIVEEYLKKHGIKLNFLIPKDEIEILQPIGEGGYGQVNLGRWLGQEVAVKVPPKISSALRQEAGSAEQTHRVLH